MSTKISLRMNKEKLSVISDPFKKSCISGVSMYMTTGFGGQILFWGSVEFENGNTKGKQKFQANSFDELYLKVSEFIKTL